MPRRNQRFFGGGDIRVHDGGPVANTSLPQLGLYIALGAAGLSMFMYSISRDEKSSLAKWIDSYRAESQKTWEYRNTLRSDLKEQAARDKHLFSTSQKDQGYELRTPEYVGLSPSLEHSLVPMRQLELSPHSTVQWLTHQTGSSTPAAPTMSLPDTTPTWTRS